MTDAPTLVRVKMTTTRAALCGVHISGLAYDLPPEIAKQFVEEEHVADYVTTAPEASAPAGAERTWKRKR